MLFRGSSILISILLFSQPAAFADSAITISSQNTNSSLVVVQGQLDPTTKWVWIHIEKTGEEPEEISIAPVQNAFSQKVFLRHGPGNYEINVLEASSAAKDGPDSVYIQTADYPVQNLDSENHAYLLPSATVQSDDENIIALAQQIVAGKTDDFSRSRAIHDWVATHVAYDTLAYFSNADVDYTALSTLQNRVAECTGYARLSAALHRAIGIPARDVSGQSYSMGSSGSHLWNEVFINGIWVTEDPTWDAGSTSSRTQKFTFHLTEKYFNPSAKLFALDHQREKVEEGE